jgi:hypothetical protein
MMPCACSHAATACVLASRARSAEKVLYRNPLAAESAVRDFRLEGQAAIQFRERPHAYAGRPGYGNPGFCILFFVAAGIGERAFHLCNLRNCKGIPSGGAGGGPIAGRS